MVAAPWPRPNGEGVNPERVVLASKSPQRKALLASLGIDFEVVEPNVT